MEGANGPASPLSNPVRKGRGVFVAPDILANAGGVTVSYFEWVQNLQKLFWTKDDVNRRLHAGHRPGGRGQAGEGNFPLAV